MRDRTTHKLKLSSGGAQWLVPGVILLGILVRAAAFGAVPGGLNQDEAFAGYEAWCLLTGGTDSWGYPFPCYFVSWGSGMNVLESYLAVPFVALLGCVPAAVRLPQLLLACLSLPVFYDLLLRLFSRRTALLGLGLLAVSPWHIMLSRWGLESNLAPAFLLFGFYFLIRGLEDGRFLLLSALAYGVSLYAYAINWVVVPLTLCVCGGYLLASGRRFAWKCLLGAAGILFLLALPLLLFLLVNLNVMDEIVTPWLSIPRLAAMRGSELSPANLLSPESYAALGRLLLFQSDGLIWNGMEGFGLFYPFTLPLATVGLARLAGRKGQPASLGGRLMLLALACSALVCLMVERLNVNKANSLHLFLPALAAVGLDGLFALGRVRWLPRAALAAYACAFAAFAGVYFTGYNDQVSAAFQAGVGEAVAFVKEENFSRVAVDGSVYYSQILFYDQTPQEEYSATVVYENYPSTFLEVDRFGRYRFGVDCAVLEKDTAYLVPASREGAFAAAGWQTRQFEGYLVAWNEA